MKPGSGFDKAVRVLAALTAVGGIVVTGLVLVAFSRRLGVLTQVWSVWNFGQVLPIIGAPVMAALSGAVILVVRPLGSRRALVLALALLILSICVVGSIGMLFWQFGNRASGPVG